MTAHSYLPARQTCLPPITRYTRLTHTFMLIVMVMASLMTPMLSAQTPDAQPTVTPYGQGKDVYLTTSGMAIQNHVLYMTWPASSGQIQRYLVAINITNPDKPQLLGKVAINGFPQGVALLNHRAMVVNGKDLLTIDITSPAQMKITHTLPIADHPMQGPQAIVIDHQHTAYLACRRGGVTAVKLTNPDKPTLTSKLPLAGFVRDIALANQQLFVAADTLGFYIIKLPDKPIALSKILPVHVSDDDTWPGSFGSVLVDQQEVFLAGGRLVLGSYLLTASHDDDFRPWPRESANRGEKAAYYGTYAHHLAVLNLPDAAAGAPTRIALVADGEAGLSVINLSKQEQSDFIPQLPAKAGASANSMLAINLIVQNHFVYVIDQNYGLRVFDLTQPTQPRLTGNGVALAD